MGVEDAFSGVSSCCIGCDRRFMVGLGVDMPELIGGGVPVDGEQCVSIVINGAVVFGERGSAAGIAELPN